LFLSFHVFADTDLISAVQTVLVHTEMLRKAHFKQQSKRSAGGSGAAKQQLSSEQVAQLVGLFERYNAHKANMDVIVEAMGEAVTKSQVCLYVLK